MRGLDCSCCVHELGAVSMMLYVLLNSFFVDVFVRLHGVFPPTHLHGSVLFGG